MSLRYLFGPVPANFADQKLHKQRQEGTCLTFNARGDADLRITAGDDWKTIQTRFPVDWQADLVVLNLGYTSVPECLWSVPLPLVGLAQDWNLLWHYYRRRLRQCELVLTDTLGVETLLQEGITHARSANLYGCDRSSVEESWPETARDVDVLFVGNFNPAVQRERMPWLPRLARLIPRRNVVLATGVFGADYRRLLARSRIVFNHSIRGECNLRAFEAAAAGALLFQEEGNREVSEYFQDRRQCVYYNAETLHELLEHYLDHEDERRTIAEAAQRQVRHYTFAQLWDQQLERIETELPGLRERVAQRVVPGSVESLKIRTWQRLCSSFGDDPSLAEDLQALLEREPQARLHPECGLVAGLERGGNQATAAGVTETALAHFRAAWTSEPGDVMASLNAAEALGDLGRREEAIAQAQSTLRTLEQAENLLPTQRDAGYFSPSFDVFRVEWERAAWTNAGRPHAEDAAKRTLLRWRLHSVLASWTGELEHFRQAQRARPDLWPTLAALGCALGQIGQPAPAVEYLRAAVTANPLDAAAARALYHALGQIGDRAAQQELSQERWCLVRALPHLASEPWFENGSSLHPVNGSDVNADWLEILAPGAFRARFGELDTARALCGFTNAQDTQVILTLLAQARPRRILEIGTALGHMTANFTEWSGEDAQIFSLGTTVDLAAATALPQRYETPDRGQFGCQANAFGKVGKVFFITADSLSYDFRRLEWLDFVFIDGAHDMRHVLSDSLNAYEILRPGSYLIWHDFTSPVDWVEVRRTLEKLRFPEKVVHVAGTAVAFLRKGEVPVQPARSPINAAQPVGRPREVTAEEENGPLFIVWEGAQQAVHSFAGVNRALCTHLLAKGHAISVLASDRPGLAEPAPNGTPLPAGYRVVEDSPVFPLPPPLAESFYRDLARPAEFHVRHQWPPQFTPPSSGHWIFMQPWEYGVIPQAWVEPLTQSVDEIWACSRFVRDCYLAAGIPAERVHVVPGGVDCERFQPQAPALSLPTNKRFKFLFVGGTIYRKGIDVLLEVYARSFRSSDDVCLVVKDMGVGSFYQGQTAQQQIAQLQEQADAPEILYLDRELSEAELAGLYAACDCLVHPYRGEGFGLPIAEAMACGLPVIVTGLGAALDFCTPDHAYLIPAQRAFIAQKRIGEWETADYPWLAEPDPVALAQLLRHVYGHAEEAREKGRRGCEWIRRHFTWEQAAQAAERRMHALRKRPIRRLQSGTAEAKAPARRSRVSLCMIVKNEESNLPACLESVAGLVDEIIVVDTGSTDRTKDIAAEYDTRVFDFAWCDSFAAARNESLCHATGEWIFWLDADDRLDEENRQRLRTLFAGLPDANAAFVMKCLCLPDPESRTATVVDHVRLFRNDPSLRWEYRVHEQILPALRRLQADVRWSEVVIRHVGYQEPVLRGRKLERDRRLLQLESAEKPDDPFILFNLGSIAQELGQLQDAVALLRRSLERSNPRDSIVRKLYALLAQCHRRLGQDEAALERCRQGREIYPDDVELLFQEGLVLREQGDRAGAKACWLQLLRPRRDEHFASLDTGLCGYKARHNLAQICLEEGDLTEAGELWRLARAEKPDFVPAWLGQAEVSLLQSRWSGVEGIAAELADEGLAVEADVLRARVHLARREFAAARLLLEETVARSARRPEPRRFLSHALLQEGQDWTAAECALEALLAVDPDDAEARSNLALLRRQRTPELVAT